MKLSLSPEEHNLLRDILKERVDIYQEHAAADTGGDMKLFVQKMNICKTLLSRLGR